MSRNKNRPRGVVFSTNANFDYEYDASLEQDTLPVEEQKLYVSLDSKNRKGKVVTLVEGFAGSGEDLKILEKLLKSKCGVGGTSKNGDIIIQGQGKQKVFDLLTALGYSVKMKG